MSEQVKKPGFLSRVARPFRDMRGELKKVVWPTRKQLVNNTLVVIGFSLLAAVFVGGLDMLLTTLIDLLLKRM